MSKTIDYEQVLNPSQREAVMTTDGPVLVVAGAGSGKTRTLVYRVARLIEIGLPQENILLLTFTRKAAAEMLDRAADLADERCRFVSGGTFHALAHRVLRNHSDRLGLDRGFTILDRSDMEEVAQYLVREIRIDRTALRFPKRATLANILSKSANLQVPLEDLVVEEYAQFLACVPQLEKLQSQYREYKRENQLVDYDDLILLFRQLLAEKEDVRRSLSNQYRYIMVDEYQDTNRIQADIVQWLAHEHQNVMVVGDDSQSIYSFRGADYRNMFAFPESFPDVKTIKLEQNYRSTQPILALTNALMDQAEEKFTKCLFTHRSDGVLPRLVNTGTDAEQALFICRTIRQGLDAGGSLKDFAVLFRAGYHSFELEMELARQGIPFVKYGGFKFMESAHIKDLLAHLRVVVNRQDVVSWHRVLKMVKHIGTRKSQAIVSWMKESGALPHQVAEWPNAAKKEGGLKALGQLLKRVSAKGVTPAKAVTLVTRYYDPILKEHFDDYPKRQKDLEQLQSIAERYQRLRTFLDDLALDPPASIADVGRETPGEVLTLSTVHSAKGLEWSVVFILWVVDGYFPPFAAQAKAEAVEEERRLLYVAATRARDRLIMCYPGAESHSARFRYSARSAGGRGHHPSSFLMALPEGLMEHQQARARDFGFTFKGAAGPAAQAPPRPSRPLRPRQESGTGLRTGDRVRHPAFGKGVVCKIQDQEKVEVLFGKVGRKLLHLAYTTLERI